MKKGEALGRYSGLGKDGVFGQKKRGANAPLFLFIDFVDRLETLSVINDCGSVEERVHEVSQDKRADRHYHTA